MPPLLPQETEPAQEEEPFVLEELSRPTPQEQSQESPEAVQPPAEPEPPEETPEA